MRYRHPKSHQAKLAQYFTPPKLAASLVARLKGAGSVLELGAGDGALIAAALRRFPEAHITAVELDSALLPALRARGPLARVARADVMNAAALKRTLGDQRFAAAIGNPPFGEAPSVRASPVLRAQFPSTDRGGWIRRDVVFVWESWERLMPGGTLAMIVAAPLICDPVFQPLRQHLARNSARLEIFQLDDDAQVVGDVFEGVEVHTFLLVAQKRKTRQGRDVLLHRCSTDGVPLASTAITRADAARMRWDFQFHDLLKKFHVPSGAVLTLQQAGAEVSRGSRSHSIFAHHGTTHVHTNNFGDGTTRLRLKGNSIDASIKHARKGDILVPRVGSRCLLRQAVVISGTAPHTEAVYRIRVERQYQGRVLRALESPFGVLWRRVHARGSCALHLTVDALLSMPLPE